MKLFIDVTSFLFFSELLKSGISRVEKNIISESKYFKDKYNIDVSYLCYTGIREKKFIKIHLDNKLLHYFLTVYIALCRIPKLKNLILTAFPFNWVRKYIDQYWQGNTRILISITSFFFILPILFLSIIIYILALQTSPWKPEKDDVLLIPGRSWWNFDIWPEIIRARCLNAKIVFFIHDIIPFTHPEFFDESFGNSYRRNFSYVYNYADLILANSRATKDSIENHLTRIRSNYNPSIKYFHLGFESEKIFNGNVRNFLSKSLFKSGKVFLCVGTIEPRKNYTFVLDAFDFLWRNGSDVSLCIVGRYGWGQDELIARIYDHEKWGEKLFWFTDINDAELDFCYKNSQALIIASVVEGFGLPLVEALNRNCNVLASDIEIFHEVGKTFCSFFSLGDTHQLGSLIQRVSTGNLGIALKTLSDFSIRTWEDSIAQMVTILVNDKKIGRTEKDGNFLS